MDDGADRLDDRVPDRADDRADGRPAGGYDAPRAARLPTTSGPPEPPTAWEEVTRRITAARYGTWLAVTGADGAPHVRPVLTVRAAGGLHVCFGAGTAKARHVARDPRASLGVAADGLDVVVEGVLEPVRDEGVLREVAGAYRDAYGWDPVVADGAFAGPAGAPTAGPPPYDVFVLAPRRAYGFPAGAELAPTRWDFAR